MAMVDLEIFKNDIATHSDTDLIAKYYENGPPAILGADREQHLREAVAARFKIDVGDVFLVGSAKLGFSIKPQRLFLPFDPDASDIDVVLISTELFESVWREAYSYVRKKYFWREIDDFRSYHFRGWIRPDKLPAPTKSKFAKLWWNYFEGLTASQMYGPYPIRAGLYHSRHFFEIYQGKSFSICRHQL